MDWTGHFLKGVFSESDGTPSFARIASGVITAFACGWVTPLVVRNHALPELTGLTALIGVVYGLNKFATALGAK